jgi:hypothetical protein
MNDLCAIAALMLAGTSAWGGVSDDFESYAVGGLPGGDWQDFSDWVANPTIPSPSATVVQTTDAHGNQTRAVQIDGDGIGTSGGIGALVEHSRVQRFEADIRIDQRGDGSYPNWTYAAGFFQVTDQTDPIRMPQALVYSLNNSNEFRLYIHNADGNGGRTRDIAFGVDYELDTWYRIALEVDTDNGQFSTTIINLESGEQIVDRSITVRNWDSNFGQYNMISLNDGEYGPDIGSIGNITSIDNVSYVPAPASVSLFGFGMLCQRRRRT